MCVWAVARGAVTVRRLSGVGASVGVDGVGCDGVGAAEFGEGAACRVDVAPVRQYRVVAEIATGLEPEGVAVDAQRRRAFVACARSDAVTVVDLVGKAVAAEVRVGREPMDIAFDDATGRLFTADLLGETVSVVDSSTLRLVAAVPVGLYPSGLA